jgi:hypothetical protein
VTGVVAIDADGGGQYQSGRRISCPVERAKTLKIVVGGYLKRARDRKICFFLSLFYTLYGAVSIQFFWLMLFYA